MGEGDARTVEVVLAGSLEIGVPRGAELVVTSVVDFVLPTATAPFTIVPSVANAWSLASYAAQWQLFNPAAGAVTQLADGVRLLAPPGPDSIWLASRAQFDPADGFEIDFDYRVLDSHGEETGTFIGVGLVRGDGTAGHPAEVDQWGDVPTEANLQAHAAGLRAIFANRNDTDPAIESEFRIRLYPSYTQFTPAIRAMRATARSPSRSMCPTMSSSSSSARHSR